MIKIGCNFLSFKRAEIGVEEFIPDLSRSAAGLRAELIRKAAIHLREVIGL